METGGGAGEEVIVDIQKGQPRYADRLLLEQQKADSATKHLSSGQEAAQHIEEPSGPACDTTPGLRGQPQGRHNTTVDLEADPSLRVERSADQKQSCCRQSSSHASSHCRFPLQTGLRTSKAKRNRQQALRR
ncbi:hypothetical protein EYF80_010321 [Liparis tanakae]|uniref:Uncharacterized protein n=1 Tax=Liparis tanakae TaxID=230148 RepID=A0A4Z2IPU3_9TELE|nr:hypothetical protein EYF80_010321 [Liparis tanakae]